MKNLLLSQARESRGWTQQDLADELGVTKLSVGRWERGEALPHRGFRRKLCDLFGMSEHALFPLTELETADSPSPSQALDPAIPLEPMLRLVGRDDDIERIKQRLCAGKSVALTAINGLPGVGKTALAIALAHDPAI